MAYLRNRKRMDSSGLAALHEEFKCERRALSNMIQAAKDESWKQLCEQVEKDPWGHPYKVVMRNLNNRRPIPGLDSPRRLDFIVDALFPTRPMRISSVVPVDEELEISKFSQREVSAAVKSLPNGKTPGSDGIPNEVLKAAVAVHPEYFADLYNKCVRNAVYPAK